MKLIDGKKIAEKIKDDIVAEIINIKRGYACSKGRPDLAIILVGDREDSQLYVELKEKEAKKVGVDTHLYKIPVDAEQKEVEQTIDFLNSDKNIDAILLQLPLPKGFDTDELIKMIDPKKDVDRFHPENIKNISLGCSFREKTIPPLLQTVFEILDEIKIEVRNKMVCAVVNSDIFGQSIKKVFECRGARVSVCRADDKDLKNKTSQADVLISAVGQPGLIKAEHIKEEACLIDIGITKDDKGKVFGDIDIKSVSDKAGYVTPVPGGVGPITIATALRNTLELYKENECK